MKSCPECAAMIADEALACPACAEAKDPKPRTKAVYQPPKEGTWQEDLIWAFGIFAVGFVIIAPTVLLLTDKFPILVCILVAIFGFTSALCGLAGVRKRSTFAGAVVFPSAFLLLCAMSLGSSPNMSGAIIILFIVLGAPISTLGWLGGIITIRLRAKFKSLKTGEA